MPAAYRGRRDRRQARGKSQAEEEGDKRRAGVHGLADVGSIYSGANTTAKAQSVRTVGSSSVRFSATVPAL